MCLHNKKSGAENEKKNKTQSGWRGGFLRSVADLQRKRLWGKRRILFVLCFETLHTFQDMQVKTLNYLT